MTVEGVQLRPIEMSVPGWLQLAFVAFGRIATVPLEQLRQDSQVVARLFGVHVGGWFGSAQLVILLQSVPPFRLLFW